MAEKRTSSNRTRRPGRKDGRRAQNTPDYREVRDTSGEMQEYLFGRHPVIEALNAGRGMNRILIARGATGSVEVITAKAKEAGIPIQYVDTVVLDHLAQGENHQGTAAAVTDFEYTELEEILERAGETEQDPLLLLLDGIQDPHNLGAIIRSAEAAGVHGVVIPRRRAAAVTPVVEKTAAGATAHLPVARVTNLVRTIEELKTQGFWIAAADMDGQPYTRAGLTGPLVLVIGSEGRGVSRLVKEACDFTVSIPMHGKVNSLNASNAAAILVYEVLRQRSEA